MKSEKNSARNTVVAAIRHASLELSNLAVEIEGLADLKVAEKKLLHFPKLLLLIRQGAWELQNARLDKAFELIQQANDEMASEALASVEVE
ncbi:hypothetical protein H6G27_09930 [Nostoc linckia FACHB-104]|nr:hypothetical protein [Nostoc linckia FACHB-104]